MSACMWYIKNIYYITLYFGLNLMPYSLFLFEVWSILVFYTTALMTLTMFRYLSKYQNKTKKSFIFFFSLYSFMNQFHKTVLAINYKWFSLYEQLKSEAQK